MATSQPSLVSRAYRGTGTDSAFAPRKKRSAREQTLALPFNESGGLHVVQRAATPACEPIPIAVDVVAGAVVPARVEQVSAATAYLIRIGVLFRAAAALLIRLLAGLVVSHNVLSSGFLFSFRRRITRCGGGPPVMLSPRR